MREILAESEAAAAFVKSVLWTPFIPDTHKVYLRDNRGRPLDGKDGRDLQIDEPNTIATATAAAMTGRELGLDFFTSLRSIYILNGQPSLYVKAARGLVQAAGHHVVIVETTRFKARVRVRRHNEDDWQEALWDEPRAKEAGLLPGRGDKSPWRLNQKAMLVARATGEGCNWIGGDVLLGVPIYEELYDQFTEEAFAGTLALPPGTGSAANGGEAAGEDKPARRTARRKSAAPASEGTVTTTATDGQPGAGQAATSRASTTDTGERDSRVITKPMRDRMMAGLRDLGYDLDDEDGRRNAYNLIGGWIGRKIETTKTLVRADMAAVFNGLDALLGVGAKRADGDDVPPPDEEPPR
jgi:hypothetical protein